MSQDLRDAPVAPPPGAPVSRPGPRWPRVAALAVVAVLAGGGAGAVTALVVDNGEAPATSSSSAPVIIRNPQTATTATAAAAKATPSVVTIYVSTPGAAGSGSGVILSADGDVLTNNHVVALEGQTGSATVQARTADGAVHDATVVGTDPTSDLAVIRLSGVSGLQPATFADSDGVQVGDQAVAIGAPLGLTGTVTDGIISAVDRAVATGTNTEVTAILALQTDAAINPGNSGGALVNAAGEVIGINSAIASVAPQDVPGQQSGQSGNIGVGFAIPANTAQRIAQEIVRTGRATHALLGVSTRTAAENPEVGLGAAVEQVTPGGPAADAGLRVGDVVTAVDGHQVVTSIDLTAYVRSAEPGQRIALTVQRDGRSSTVDVTLGTAPS